MNVTSRGRYALRVMLDLAQHPEDGYVSLKTVAERQDISMKYLEAIVCSLKKAELVESSRGKEGGYRLVKSPAEYTVGEILRLTEGSLSPVACVDPEPAECDKMATCPMLPVWKGLAKVIDDYLDGITLGDILDSMSANDEYNYVI